MTHQISVTRRDFLVGCSTAIAAMAGGRLGMAAFSDPTTATNEEVLVVVFLRGGMDGLNLVPPIGGPDREFYEVARPTLKVPTTGNAAARELGQLGTVQLGLNSLAAPLYELYQERKLAIIHAVGLRHETRSHFDAMEFMELGTPGAKGSNTGWLTRHLQSAPNLPDTIITPAMMAGNATPTSLLSSTEALAISGPDSFTFSGNWRYVDLQRMMLRRMYNGDSFLHRAGTQTLNSVDIIESTLPRDNDGRYTYAPANGAQYPDGSFSRNMQTVAQMIKLDLGLRVATVDLGGWDTHENQGSGDSTSTNAPFPARIDELARTLFAFYTDLSGAGSANYMRRVTVVVMSEFGRRLKENGNRGTDHGHGNVMLVLGGGVNGGLYGNWPGLDKAQRQLFQDEDLAITTDYRQVLSEILIRRMGNPNIATIFPGYSGYVPLGVVQGEDLQPVVPNYDYQSYLPHVVRGFPVIIAPYPEP